MAQGRQAINAIPAAPPVYGLLVAADTVDLDARWQAGVEWAPENIGGGQIGVVACGGTASVSPTDNAETQTADPVLLFATDRCSAFGFEARDYEGRARRQLLATQSFMLAREFQLGTLRDADSLGNVALVDATHVGPAPASVLNATAIIESAIGEVLQGRRAMIHVSPQIFTLMKANQDISLQGQRWVTPQGSIVCSDAGYTVEEDGHLFMYATGLPIVTLGEVIVPMEMRTALDRTVNTIEFYAERLGLIRLDSSIDDLGDAMVKIQLDVAPWTTHS